MLRRCVGWAFCFLPRLTEAAAQGEGWGPRRPGSGSPLRSLVSGSDLLPVVPQGDYDQSRTKVLHLSLNPAGAARQRLHEDRQQLREECERLRELVRALEAGGAVPTDLEAAAGLPSSREVAGRALSVRPSVRLSVQAAQAARPWASPGL